MESMANEVDKQQIYNICHDFKTPLSTIMGMTALTWGELEDREKVKDHLSKIETASGYLLSMVNDILDYSKIINSKMSIRHEVFCLDNIVEFVKKLLTPQIEKKHQVFHIKLSNIHQDWLLGDFLRINQILTNLLTNSIKYTAAGGSITLEFTQFPKSHDSLFMEMRVSDTGIGMSEDFIKTMFEPYSLAEEKCEASRESTGLGLYITNNLVSLMGGEINVVSKPNVGTSITIRIPFEIPKEQHATKCEPPVAFPHGSINESLYAEKNYDFRDKCIIIAEDNPDMLEITSTVLRPSGIRILTAHNGLEALECFRNSDSGAIDMILMDVRMPVMSGPRAAAGIRSLDHPDSKRVPIVALTASDDTEEEKNARNAGMNEYVKKPIDYFHLLNLMDSYLNKSEAGKG